MDWNITGYVPRRRCIHEADGICRTVLSSAGNDGRVRLWKATMGNVWRPAGSIGVEQTEDSDANMEENTVME